jgi:hypothetical protein
MRLLVYTVALILLVIVVAIGFAIKIPMWAILIEGFRDLRKWRTQNARRSRVILDESLW